MNKVIFSSLVTIVSLFSITSCSSINISKKKLNDSDNRLYEYYSNLDTFKGLELYAFESADDYECVLMSGTNRHKTADEVNWLQKEYPCSLELMNLILDSYSEEVREWVYVAVVSSPTTDEELSRRVTITDENRELYQYLHTTLNLNNMDLKY